MMRFLFGLPILFTLSCEGELAAPRDMGPMSEPDALPAVDMPDAADMSLMDAPVDMSEGPDPLCIGVTCQANAICAGGTCYCAPGYMGDPEAGCTEGNPCDGVTCAFGATCDDDGECSCDPGFLPDALDGCEYDIPTEPAERTAMEVCERWNADYPEQAAIQWQVEPADQCDPGILDPDFQLDAIRRVSLFRWLTGLAAVTTNVDYLRWTQACAAALDAEDAGATAVDDTFQCYSEDAAKGAAESNLLRSAASPADSVDTYMEDAGEMRLAHRRWILNPDMGATGFGFRGQYSCMYALDQSGGLVSPPFVAYPMGVFPIDALRGPWSFSSEQALLTDATVTITDSGGSDVPIEDFFVAGGTFGLPTIVWTIANPVAGETYTVTIGNLAGEDSDIVYTVQLENC